MIGFLVVGLYLGVLAGLQNGLLLASIPEIRGEYALTPQQGGWLLSAYYMGNACMSAGLLKVRQQIGMRVFTRWLLVAFLAFIALHLTFRSFEINLAVRVLSGVVASGLTALSITFLIQGLPPRARLGALVIGLGLIQLSFPFARVLAPLLFYDGDIQNLIWFNAGLALLAFAGVSLLPLPLSEKIKAIKPADIATFLILACGIACFASFFSLGRIVWWTTPWLGYLLAGGILFVGAALFIEHNRRSPFIMTRWISGRTLFSFVLTAAALRVLLAEQVYGAVGFLTLVGMNSWQLVTYYGIVTLASLAGLILSVARLDPNDIRRPALVAFAFIAIASFMDVGSTSASRPSDFYLSQAMIGFAATYFFGPMFLEGIARGLAWGPDYVVSLLAVFGISQAIGGLAGVSLLSAFQTIQAKKHLIALADTFGLNNPQLVSAINASAQLNSAVQSDPLLAQAAGLTQTTRQAVIEANVHAFNDTFFLMGMIATSLFFINFAIWIFRRFNKINPLDRELKAIQKIMARQS